MKTKRKIRLPEILVSFAVTLDGKVSTEGKAGSGFGSAADLQRLRETRAECDALLVGARTVEADNMSMRLSDPHLQKKRTLSGKSPEPLRVVVSQSGKINPRWKLFQAGGNQPLVFTTQRIPASLRAPLAKICHLHILDGKEIHLDAVLKILAADWEVRRLACEGGPTLFQSLLTLDLVDELRLTMVPVIFGGAGAPTLSGNIGHPLVPIRKFRLVEFSPQKNGECFLTYRRR